MELATQGVAPPEGLDAALVVPLEGLTGIVGVLALYARGKDAFTVDHLRVLSAASTKAALSVENAIKYGLAEPPDDAEKSATGLVSVVLQKGDGTEHASADDQVQVHYTGWRQADGVMFDSSVSRKRPATFRLDQVIKGWTEGVQLMVKGEKRRFWIPADLAYGDRGRGEASGPLTFDIELLDILKPPAVPEDVKAAPATAKKTATGIAYRVLAKGTGTKKPTATSKVSVHYSGWTTDGKMFDSSVMRGQPTSFKLNGVIKGWTEGVQLMVEGEKTRFWIPGKLAYGEEEPGARPGGPPKGMLVFDIELLKIVE
jgi:peptidylprolyl isomerase